MSENVNGKGVDEYKKFLAVLGTCRGSLPVEELCAQVQTEHDKITFRMESSKKPSEELAPASTVRKKRKA